MSRGLTLLEALVALSILAIGGTSLWWGMRRGFEADQRLRWNQIVQEALVSEAERLQGRKQELLRDTAYAIPLEGATLRLRRVVLDSALRERILDARLWDEKMRQAWKTRPTEVLIEAWPEFPGADAEKASDAALSLEPGVTDTTGRRRMFVTLPDYQWF